MACSDEEIGVTLHDVLGHADLNSVRQQSIRMTLKGLEVVENAIPSTTVEANRVIPKLIKDFIHLENYRQCFDSNGCPYASFLYACHLFCPLKHTIPYLRFPAKSR
ncbi:hypothetical protein V6N13_013134 [Hibiscus sabdariffa]|uniref:Uncharacterized protein n=2 Tax=Hibiscus sabdariffa TaxID=183260 RepID=A0ABR1Z6I4_9ROSI